MGPAGNAVAHYNIEIARPDPDDLDFAYEAIERIRASGLAGAQDVLGLTFHVLSPEQFH